MSYRFKPARESMQKGVRRLARSQISKACNECVDPSLKLHERVHAVRKRCKKLRGMLRLVRSSLKGSAYRDENRMFRDLARTLSKPRDIYVMRRTYDRLLDDSSLDVDRHQLAPIAAVLSGELEMLVDDEIPVQLELAENRLREVAERSQTWELKSDGFSAVRGGLKLTYKRTYRAMCTAYERPRPEHFHELRKRAKYHRYHVRLLRSLWPEMMKLRAEQLHRLTDTLGEDHDLAVMHQWLKSESPGSADARALLRGLVMERRESCQRRAYLLAQRLFCSSQKAFEQRMYALAEASW